ncbi:nucleoside-diphosphate sugar epimerase/dehydratase [Synechococcus sp. J7-Johnson]|uniref:polysaccharide biosynthesis protein n=1 Tax=Synechococcus sp. J7-Johnson TaxID=2823737 RepID=UPI0020CED60C|nr:nucleoside-diphosphate sugar epimerase/dehydratase [Synechococcus sp. J7-Johnson]
MIAFCFWLAFALRLNVPFAPWLLSNLYLLFWAVGLGLPILLFSGWYSGLTRYSGSHSLYGFLPRSGLLVLLLLLVSTLSGNPTPPFRGFWILFWFLLSATAIGSRILLRDLLRFFLSHRHHGDPAEIALSVQKSERRIPTLVYGAGKAAHLLLTELRYHRRFRIIAVIDDNPALWGRKIEGLSIFPVQDCPGLIDAHGIQKVLLAIPSSPRARRRQLVEQMSALGLSVLSIPSLARIASGQQSVSDLRPVVIEDLLGRDPTVPDPQLLAAAVSGKVVLITGAGGSIGSELSRQILHCRAKRLVLLERNEYALYRLEQELIAAASGLTDPALVLRPVLGDVRDQRRLEALCREHGVQVLFHAAAYKHVPLVENNLCAGVANNVLGTRAALEAAIACSIERFILISTDKAVRPTNAMGASKRVCELLVQDAAVNLLGGPGPVVSMVRFGNVLGSSGSVVPRFRAQVAAGGPITVTHPEMTRYFMTIPEAVQLVLQAAGLAKGGEVFVLDMGDPVRILDLAHQMILLSGSSVRDASHPDGEIAISFTGLRPGEKLYEELLISASDEPTAHPLIRRARESRVPSQRLETLMAKLNYALAAWDDRAVFDVLSKIVIEYQPAAQADNPLPHPAETAQP